MSQEQTFFECGLENGKIMLRFKEPSDYREIPNVAEVVRCKIVIILLSQLLATKWDYGGDKF